jgi:outer membrane lipoprotein-sorting protein
MLYFFFLLVPILFADDTCWSPLKQELAFSKGFSMNFTQIDTYPFMDESKKAAGNLVVWLPDKFSWTSKGDDSGPVTIVSNGKTIWFYQAPDDPRDKGQLYINSASESVNIPAILLSCPGDDFSSFIRIKNTRILYVTGGEGKNYKWARIRYKVKPFKLLDIAFESFSSAKTTIIANSFKAGNTPVPASLFEFKPPPGTRTVK